MVRSYALLSKVQSDLESVIISRLPFPSLLLRISKTSTICHSIEIAYSQVPRILYKALRQDGANIQIQPCQLRNHIALLRNQARKQKAKQPSKNEDEAIAALVTMMFAEAMAVFEDFGDWRKADFFGGCGGLRLGLRFALAEEGHVVGEARL